VNRERGGAGQLLLPCAWPRSQAATAAGGGGRLPGRLGPRTEREGERRGERENE